MSTVIPPRRGEFFTPDGIPTQRFILWIEALTGVGNANTEGVATLGIQEKYPWELAPVNRPEFNAVTATVNYEMCDYDFVNASNGVTLTMPQYPMENSIIIVRNNDGSKITVDGNGKNINNDTDAIFRAKYSAITFQYFIDSDEWFSR